MSALDHLDAMERALVAAGFPAMSPWWRETIERFYQSGRRQLVARVGRRGGKSSTLCRLGVLEALFGDHHIPPGDMGIVAFISVSRDEAAARLRTVEAILRALRVKFRPMKFGDGIELADKPIGFRVFTASVAGVSGFTSIMAIADECAKWRDSDTGVNPATQVLASLRPTMATMPSAKLVLASSPFSSFDAHYAAFEMGDTEFQIVAYAPTWEANPTITEAQTHELEPDELTWSREYQAVPQAAGDSCMFGAAELAAVTREAPAELPPGDLRWHAAMDPATRRDAWALCIAAADGRDVRIALVREWLPRPGAPLSPKVVLAEIADVCRPYGIKRIRSDQWSASALRDIAHDVGLNIVDRALTAASKVDLFDGLRVRVAQESIELPPSKSLRADLVSIRRRVGASGISIALPRIGGRHGDSAMACAMAVAMAEPDARRPATPRQPHHPAERRVDFNPSGISMHRASGDAAINFEVRGNEVVATRRRKKPNSGPIGAF